MIKSDTKEYEMMLFSLTNFLIEIASKYFFKLNQAFWNLNLIEKFEENLID